MTWTVAEFVQRFRATLDCGVPPKWHDEARRYDEIADLGLTRSQVLEEARRLEATHHCEGPEEDHEDPTAVVHKFRYPLPGGPDCYVKISLKWHPKQRGVLVAKIWSFKRWQ